MLCNAKALHAIKGPVIASAAKMIFINSDGGLVNAYEAVLFHGMAFSNLSALTVDSNGNLKVKIKVASLPTFWDKQFKFWFLIRLLPLVDTREPGMAEIMQVILWPQVFTFINFKPIILER